MASERLPAAAVFLTLAVCSSPFAQDSHPHRIPAVPGDLLNRPVTLKTGIGSAHDTVSTTSREAQAFYDQGLAYLHSYVWIEAARSFHQALRTDATLALAYVGLSYAYVELNMPREARQALDTARLLAVNVSAHEKRHIDIRSVQFAAEQAPRDAAKLAAYRQAIDDAIAAFPADVELRLLRGVAESPDPADRGQGSTAGSITFYEKALALVPGHFAAHHYLTHAYENTGRMNEALTHAGEYVKPAGAIPHARHMYAHNLRRVGRIEEAIANLEAADQLENDYLKTEKIPAEYEWHYHHNLDLLGTSYEYVGQMRKAESLLKTGFSIPSALVVQEFNKREWPVFLRARGRAEEALVAARTLTTHPSLLIQATGHIEAGRALLMLGRFQDAATESNAALRALNAATEGQALVANALQELQGEFFLRTGQRERGRQTLESVANKLRSAPGPDAWTQALFSLEAIVRAARDVGDWDFAAQMANQMLQHDPAYAGTHYALALVADHNGDRKTAAAEFALAEKYWNHADADLAELQRIRNHKGH